MTNAKTFPASVATTLRREGDREGIVVPGPGRTWALVEWYPRRPKKASGATEADSAGEMTVTEPPPQPMSSEIDPNELVQPSAKQC